VDLAPILPKASNQLLSVLHHCLKACPHARSACNILRSGPVVSKLSLIESMGDGSVRFAQVDNHFKTSVEGVYAIGDCIPGPMLAHKAEEDGYVLAEMLAGKPGHVDYNHVPSIVYTDPEVRTARRVCRWTAFSVLSFHLHMRGCRCCTRGAGMFDPSHL